MELVDEGPPARVLPELNREDWMREALAVAASARAVGETPVGAVFVAPLRTPGDEIGVQMCSNDNYDIGTGISSSGRDLGGQESSKLEWRIVGRGHNETNASKNGTSHAELVMLSAMEAEGVLESVLEDGVLFVTVEPCIMCAAVLRLVGVRSVVFGCANNRFGGNGSVLSLASGGNAVLPPGYSVVSGVLADEAVGLLKNFYEAGNPNAPKPHRTPTGVTASGSTAAAAAAAASPE